MQTVLPSEFKRMMVVMWDGSPYLIEDFHTSGTAQTRHKLHARLRQLHSGHILERVFSENERIPVVALETRPVTYSYIQGDQHFFLDVQSYDEYALSEKQLGERHWFLKANEEYKALLIDGNVIDIVVPPQVSLNVVETAPPIKGGSDSAWKEARLETGLNIMVPLFIAQGETIRVDTTTRKYIGRSSPGD